MILSSIESLCQQNPEFQQRWQTLEQAQSLPALVCSALQLGLMIARRVLESELNRRAQVPTTWPECPHCGQRLRSKGLRSRQMTTLIGVIR